jgi:anaphase-promoting complex subunit 3
VYSRVTNDSSFYLPDNTFQQAHRTTRSQPSNPAQIPPHVSRPLSSADEAGPAAKRQRSTARQPEAIKISKSNKLALDNPLKKARARPALLLTNLFSSSGRRSQPTASTRTTGLGKSITQPVPPNIRRSSRLLSGTGTKQSNSKASNYF